MGLLVRKAVRAFLLDPDDRLLMLLTRLPQGGAYWIAPGGGLQPGETPEQALRRELDEELGLTRLDLGPLLWRRDHDLTWAGRRFRQSEQYFVAHVPHFRPVMRDAAEAASLMEFRWWPQDALRATTDALTPTGVAGIIADYLQDGPPPEPGHEQITD